MNFIQKYIDKQLKTLGYLKAGEVPETVLFRGETYPGQEQNIWADWRLQHFQLLAMQHPIFFSNLKLVADAMAMGTAIIEERIGKEEYQSVIDHPFETIIESRPNPYQSQYYAWWYQVGWLLIQGEAYWMLIRDGTDELIQVYPLPANRVKPIPDETGQVLFKHFAYTPISGDTPHLLEPTQICYHRIPNLFDYHRGYSLLNAFLAMLKLSTEADNFDLEDYQNGLTLKTILSLRPEISQRDKLQFEADIAAAQRDGKRLLVARGGDLSSEAIAQRRDDGRANNETVHQRVERLANLVLGIPDGLRARNATEANAKVAKEMFIEFTIWPLMQMIAEDWTAQVITQEYGEQFRLNFEDIRPVNKELELQEKDSLRQVQTYNEAREADGLEPHSDPDIGEAPYTAANRIAEIKIQSGQTATEEGEVTTPPDVEVIPELVLNGAQVQAALDIVNQVALGVISRQTGQGALEVMFNFTPEQASKVLGDTGKDIDKEAVEMALENLGDGKATIEQIVEMIGVNGN